MSIIPKFRGAVKRRLPSIAQSYVDSRLLNPFELLETLAARQKYQRSNEQTHIDDDRHANDYPTHYTAGGQVIPDVEESWRGEGQVVNAQRQESDRQPGVKNQRRPPDLVVGGERPNRVMDEEPGG